MYPNFTDDLVTFRLCLPGTDLQPKKSDLALAVAKAFEQFQSLSLKL